MSAITGHPMVSFPPGAHQGRRERPDNARLRTAAIRHPVAVEFLISHVHVAELESIAGGGVEAQVEGLMRRERTEYSSRVSRFGRGRSRVEMVLIRC